MARLNLCYRVNAKYNVPRIFCPIITLLHCYECSQKLKFERFIAKTTIDGCSSNEAFSQIFSFSFFFFFTFETTTRNDETIVHVDQTVPLRVLGHVGTYLSRQILPNAVQSSRPFAILGFVDAFQDGRVLRPVWQCPVHQLVRRAEIFLDVPSHLASRRFAARSVHQTAEAVINRKKVHVFHVFVVSWNSGYFSKQEKGHKRES